MNRSWFPAALRALAARCSPRRNARTPARGPAPRTAPRPRLHVEALEDRAVPAAAFAQLVDPNPAFGNDFGAHVVPLSNGNVVVTARGTTSPAWCPTAARSTCSTARPAN